MEHRLIFDYAHKPLAEWQENETVFFNAWRGFKHQPKDIKTCKDKDAALLYSKWLAFLKEIIADNQQDIFDYICCWIAHLFQKTGEKPGTALCLKGNIGAGKSVFCDMLAELIGQDFCYCTSDKLELMSQYTDAMVENLFVNIDNFWWTNSLDGRIRNWIANERQPVRKVGHCPIVINSCTRYVITGSDQFLLRIPEGDCRYFMVRISDRRKGDADYFRDLVGNRRDKEKLARAAPYLTHFFQTYNIQRWRAYPFIQTKEYLAEKRKTRGALVDYLTDVYKGRIGGVYFWNNQQRAHNANISASDWSNPYEDKITIADFERQMNNILRYEPSGGEYLFARVQDLSKGYDRKSPRSAAQNISAAIRSGLGGKNIKRERVCGLKVGSSNWWYILKKESLEQWLSAT